MSDDKIPDGALRIHRMTPDDNPILVIVRHCGKRYGAEYIQFPERGVPSGGSSWAWPASCFRMPETAEERLWVTRYLTAKRVRDLTAQLEEAKADAAAVTRYAALLAREAP